MKKGTHYLGTAVVFAVTAGLIALIWVATIASIRTQRNQTLSRLEPVLAGQAVSAAAQVEHQIIAVQQMLTQMASAWQADPDHVDITAIRRRAVTVDGIAKDVLLADASGVIQKSTLPEAVGQGVANQDYFVAFLDRPSGSNRLFLGLATIGPILRQWHMNAALPLHNRDGSFAGAVNTDYRVSAITEVLQQPALGDGGLAFLVGLRDGKLRSVAGAAPSDPDLSISDTPLLGVVKGADSGLWIGRSPIDGATRIHAFRQLPDRGLAIVVAMDEQVALAPASAWQRETLAFAAAGTILLGALAWMLTQRLKRAAEMAEAAKTHAEALAYANAQSDVFQATAEVRSQQLATTLAGAGEGICIIDDRLCLVEWNDRFADLASIPAAALRVGMPLEEMLRAQVEAGSFGRVADSDAEIAFRMSRLRTASEATFRRTHPDGRLLELRRKNLPTGGYVRFYTDLTDLVSTEEQLSEARELLGKTSAIKARFVEAIASELESPVQTLGTSLDELAARLRTDHREPALDDAQRSHLALTSILADIAEAVRLDAGAVEIRPTLLELHRVLADAISDYCSRTGADRRIVRTAISPALPAALYTDAGLLRNAVVGLIGSATAIASDGDVLLEALPGRNPSEGIVLQARVDRTALSPEALAKLVPAVGDAAIDVSGIMPLRHAISVSQAKILRAGLGAVVRPSSSGETSSGETGVALWLALPPQALPIRPLIADPGTGAGSGDSRPTAPIRKLPRTRILLVEDIVANQIVTATLLRRAGHLIDIASSGADAIAAVGRIPYDLVFMDVMMPGMSGPDAAAAIRALLPAERLPPIVALTADASMDHRDGDLGFDKVLRKPVELAELLDVIAALVWYRYPHRDADGTDAITTAEGQPEPHLLATKRLQELRMNLSPDTFVSLVEECLTDIEAQLPALRRAVAAGALGAVVAHAHAMVGMAAGYGMAALETSVRHVLNAAKAGDRDSLNRDAIARIEADLAASARALREMMQDILA